MNQCTILRPKDLSMSTMVDSIDVGQSGQDIVDVLIHGAGLRSLVAREGLSPVAPDYHSRRST